VKPPRYNDDTEYLQAYVDAIEKGPDSLPVLTRQGTDAMRVQAKIEPGQAIVVQESYDPAWHAWQNGKPLPLRKDAMGMMVIDAPPGDADIQVAFVTPLENQVGRILTAITVLLLLVMLAAGIRAERRA
jgi:uncharacterized membrane protein YfhO